MRVLARLSRAALVVACLALPAAAREVQHWEMAPYRQALYIADIGGKSHREVSGLAVSNRSDDLLWAINDSGGGTSLYALGRDGRDLGSVRVKHVRNRDWEDLASFRLGDSAYLLIADVGDNGSKRRSSTLYVVEEPELLGERFPKEARVSPAWTIHFQYEDGPLDCEAVAVDAPARRVLLLSKRRFPSLLFELPLVPGGADELVVARRVTQVRHLPVPPPFLRRVLAAGRRSLRHLAFSATAMDIARDGSRAVVLTYGDAFLFVRSGDESWAAVFARPPQRIALPPLRQAEAIAFAPDGQTLYVTSEGRSAPLLRLDREVRRAEPDGGAEPEAPGERSQE